jgi:hypothetical protein
VNIVGFDEHSVSLIGEALVSPSEKKLAAVFSSENLLLNGYRYEQCGMPLQLCADTTYRLVVEGHGTLLVGLMSLDQKFHIIAYAVLCKEDTEHHEHCFRQIKKGVEAVVHKYAENGWSA